MNSGPFFFRKSCCDLLGRGGFYRKSLRDLLGRRRFRLLRPAAKYRRLGDKGAKSLPVDSFFPLMVSFFVNSHILTSQPAVRP